MPSVYVVPTEKRLLIFADIFCSNSRHIWDFYAGTFPVMAFSLLEKCLTIGLAKNSRLALPPLQKKFLPAKILPSHNRLPP